MPNIRDAVVGQWYLRQDTGEMFWVTDYDDESGTVEIQTLDGDLDELNDEVWQSLPLALAEPPQDWTGPMDGVMVEDLETDPAQAGSWASPGESEDSTSADEIDGDTERVVPRDLD